MERYPTPPSTSSPNLHDHAQHDSPNNSRQRNSAPQGTSEPYPYLPHPHPDIDTTHHDKRSTINSSFTNASTIVPASTEAYQTTSKPPLDFYGITSQDASYNIPPRQASFPIPNPNPVPDLFNAKTSLDPRAKGYSYSDNTNSQTIPHRPAQETYWQTTSDPVSPSTQNQNQPQNQPQHPYTEQFNPAYPSHPGPPPRRSSSPIPYMHPSTSDTNPNPNFNPNPYYNPPHQTSQPYPNPQPQLYPNPQSQSQPPSYPTRRRSSPISTHIPNRLNSPTKPYSPSRPKPRPGLLKRLTQRLKSLLRSLLTWIRHNPIKTSLLTFIPLLLGAGVVKTVRGVKRFLGTRASKNKERKRKHKLGGLRNDAKKMEKKWHEEVFGDFKGFAGSKGGPLDGFLKIMHMLV
ncbi:hypothetical protein SBOR_7615 [Sclerotinia borealis F-4128]|uniref:Uncharacterized protein n=1 Tax=Sclerotinia borealis (strain F-4128) TaxID=1432307 RepID=W9CBR9_SCLBF|nr:hypothetical protein SBOR_7615 [Sclerotinia borealis F-4128]